MREGLFPEEVFVFTPAGDVRELTQGSTPVDFAYAIHTEVGHRCIGAKVNGSIVPLRYKLQNGDTVEILTQKNSAPSKDWLNFVVTAKARHRIRQWFKVVERERAHSLGKEMLEKEFRKEGLNLGQTIKDGRLDTAAKDLSLVSGDDLLVSVGFGKVSVRQVIGRLKPHEEGPSFVNRMVRRMRKRPKQGIKVRGINDILVRFAGCCNPLPGEEIVGYVSQGRGVTIHSARCKSLANVDPQRRVDVEWDLEKGLTYPVRIQVIAKDRPGILAELSGTIAEAQANITQASAEVTADHRAMDEFTIEVNDMEHLRRVVAKLKKLKWVERVTRLGTKA